MKRLWSWAALAAGMLAGGCGSPDGTDSTLVCSPSFAMEYARLTGIRAYPGKDNAVWILEELARGPYGTELIGPKHMADEFDSINRSHGDTHYYKKFWWPGGPLPQFITPDFVRVEVTSDADFDEAHPAGTSLGDVTRFLTVTPMEYIRSGYKKLCRWKELPRYWEYVEIWPCASIPDVFYDDVSPGWQNMFPVDERVADLTADDLAMLGRGVGGYTLWQPSEGIPLAVIKFLSRPALEGSHRVTVKFVAAGGREYAAAPLEVNF